MRRLIQLLLLIIVCTWSSAQSVTDKGWGGAIWIKVPGNDGAGSMPRFRKTVSIGKEIKSASLWTSALGIYDVHLNGKRVGHVNSDNTVTHEELKPGWTDYRKRVFYSTYDVTGYLQQGQNVLGATVASGWWMGRISNGLYGSNSLGFIAKLVINYRDGSNDLIVTDTSWKWDVNGALKRGDLYDGEEYDASAEDGWLEAGFDDSNWSACEPNSDFKGDIVAYEAGVYTLPTLKPQSMTVFEGTKSETGIGLMNEVGQYMTFPFTLKKDQTLVVDMGQNFAGWTPFTVKGKRGTKVSFRYGEMINDNGSPRRGNDGPGGSLYTSNLRSAKATLNYTMKGAAQGESYTSWSTYYGFRYCEIEADDDIEIMGLEGQPISSITTETGTVETSNQKLNQLISNIRWGQISNFVSVPTDCPQRDEKWGWTGDAQVFCRTGMYNAQTESFYRKYLQDMRDAQAEDGAYAEVAPYVGGRDFGPAGWSDAGIILPYNLYLMYGNKEILKEHYPSMERYMNWLSAQQGEGYLYQGAYTTYGDWLACEKCANRYVSVAYYAYDAMLMEKISRALSNADGDDYSVKALAYHELYENIKAEFNERFWATPSQQKTQTACILALAFDLLDGDKKERAISRLEQAINIKDGHLSTGFLGTGLLLTTLSRMGRSDLAYDLLLQESYPSWLYCVNQGATTMWERWNSYTAQDGFFPSSTNSFNHYAYGAVGEWIYRYMAGIEADEDVPGFKHFILQPQLDDRAVLPDGEEHIQYVTASYESPYGTITSSWQVNDAEGTVRYTCSVPANTTATLYLPQLPEGGISENGMSIAVAEGVRFRGVVDGCYVMELLAGEYSFCLRGVVRDDN